MPGPDFDGQLDRQNSKNRAEVRDGLTLHGVNLLRSRCQAIGLTEKETALVLEIAGRSDEESILFRSLLCTKSAKRQNCYETAFLDWAKSALVEARIAKLPGAGPRARYASDGRIVSASAITGGRPTKSFDFRISSKSGPSIYVAHKYTGIDGGSQDNQFHDLVAIGEAARGVSDAAVILLADGPYYERRGGRASSGTRLEWLADTFASEPLIRAGTSSSLPRFISELRDAERAL